jgi:hypothetical protein
MSAPLAFLVGMVCGAICLEFGAALAVLAFERWQGSQWWREPTRVQALRALLENEK